MITEWDEFPVHQTSEPIAFPATSDRNFYDRYFFHGYDVGGRFFFAVALGFYPNRSVVDGAFNVVFQDRQHIVRASRLCTGNRRSLSVGPLHVEVVEPLHALRIRVDDNPWGLQGELCFFHRTPPIEEPRFQQRAGTRLWMDYTRMTQHGRWSGWLRVQNTRFDLDPENTLGARDRSWGVRPVGEPEGGRPTLPWQFFWLWGPFHLPDACVHFALSEYADGTRWHEYAALIHDPVTQDERPPSREGRAEYKLDLRPGTRQIRKGEFLFTWDNGQQMNITLEPILHFYMAGLGYGHPEWGHGRYVGDNVVAGEVWDLTTIDPAVPLYFHVQSLAHIRTSSSEGVGVLEQLMIGPHSPTGLTGLFDPASE